MLFKDVLSRTKRALLLYKVYGGNVLLVLNGTWLDSATALLALSQCKCLKVLGKSVGGWNAKVLNYEVKW